MLDDEDRQAIAGALVPVLDAAAAVILDEHRAGRGAERKADGSPVTRADIRSEEIILAALARHWPGIPVLSEETEPDLTAIPLAQRYFVVDPLDGTREFVAGRDEFTINIALVEDGTPTLGLIAAPASGGLVMSFGKGRLRSRAKGGDELRPLPPGPTRNETLVLVSRSHSDSATAEALRKLGAHTTRALGSAWKFALVATGEADIYPRHGRTMMWDVAAGQALIEAAGGAVLTFDKKPLRYDPFIRFDNPPFVAARTPALASLGVDAFAAGG